MRYAELKSGRPVAVFERPSGLGYDARIGLVPSDENTHVVQYVAAQRSHRDHLVAHECAQLIRFYDATPESRLLPTSTPRQRAAAVEEVIDHMARLSDLGMPDTLLLNLFETWYHGAVTQLTSFPANLRIERFLKEEYPPLALQQDESLRRQVRENDLVLGSEVRDFTPPKMYVASATMNAAFADYMSRLLERRTLSQRYRASPYWKTGTELAEASWSSPDSGYAGDVETSKEWAKTFGLDEWVEWKVVPRVADRK